jgi:hypothetical protein
LTTPREAECGLARQLKEEFIQGCEYRSHVAHLSCFICTFNPQNLFLKLPPLTANPHNTITTMELSTMRYLPEALGLSFFFCLTLCWSLLLSIRNDPKPNSHGGDRKAIPTDIDNARDIVQQIEKGHKDCVVFFGSQTGTAEGYASRLAKEGKARFGLETMVANLEDYDLHNLDAFPRDKIAIFVMSTYGEGEPPDRRSSVLIY